MFSRSKYQSLFGPQLSAINSQMESIIDSVDVSDATRGALLDAIRKGRRFRPLLMLLVNSGVGGDWKGIVELGAAIELLHKASLVHDDLVDGDKLRRGCPTVWKTHGERRAVIIGDVLVGLAFTTVSDWTIANSSPHIPRIFSLFAKAMNYTAIGEFLDVEFESESATNIDTSAVGRMIALKSGTLISTSMEIGGITGGASDELCQVLAELGMHVGTLFQFVNDVNNIAGVDGESKGQWGGDVVLKKKTYATLALSNSGKSCAEVQSLSAVERMTCLQPALAEIQRHVSLASQCLNKLPTGVMKGAFSELLESAQEEWFWVDSDR